MTTQAAQVNQWLQLAPEPPALTNDKKWHVFLSYRSVNRNWVLHLYDALRAVGFQVFLDQLEIAAGDSLARRLNSALEASTSGVIVASSSYEDSEWCKSEYDTMESLRKSRGFRFVVAKLDDARLPPMAEKDLYVDFSSYPTGPQGGELLRLMFGLLGRALPSTVLKLALAIDDQTKAALAQIAGAKVINNVESLVNSAREGGEVWQASPLLYCACAEALLELGEEDRALEVLALSTQFKHAIRPTQLNALAWARKAKRMQAIADERAASEAERSAARASADRWLGEAQQPLAELWALGHRDPETLGIYARTWMDRYLLTGRRVYLEKSRDLYRQAFELNDDNFYTGINAAAKSVFLGELEVAAELVGRVQALVGCSAIRGNYWKTATVAEALLIQRKYQDSIRVYRSGTVDAPLAIANQASARAEAELLLEHLGAPPEVREQLVDAFKV